MNFKFVAVTLSLVLMHAALSAIALPRQISGPSVLDESHLSMGADPSKKGLVIVFLSAVCPCSNSHLAELISLHSKFKDFDFIGIHSNTDEALEPTRKYFRESALPFPVVKDAHAKLADEFKAYKTPHVFVLSSEGEISYQGGVSSSRHFSESADKKFLRMALEELAAGKKVSIPEGRTLGCTIAREGKYVW